MTEPRTAPDHNLKGWPKGVPYIIGNEGCERFSYYGMKALLIVYITGLYINLRGMSEQSAEDMATTATHLFSAAVYTLPLIGAVLADRLWGKYKTILYLSVVYCLGHLALAIFEDPMLQKNLLGDVYIDPIQGLMIGLGLIALGSGGIKPCVSAHVGDQFGRGNWHLLQKVFNAFYFMINLGSGLATIIIPQIQGDLIRYDADWNVLTDSTVNAAHYAYSGHVGWAFGIPGILMGLATIVFWMGRKTFIHVPATPGGKTGRYDFLSGSFLTIGLTAPLFMFLADIHNTNLTLGISLVSIALFVILFRARQKIEQDDGFLAVMFYSVENLLDFKFSKWQTPTLARMLYGVVAATGFAAVLIYTIVSFSGGAAGALMALFVGSIAYTFTLVGLRLMLEKLLALQLIRSNTGDGTETAVETSSAVAYDGGEKEYSPAANPNHWFFGPAVQRFGRDIVEGPIAVLKVISVLAVISVFWGLFHQHSTTWVHQAKAMDRNFELSQMTWIIIGICLGASIALAAVLSLTKSHKWRWLITLAGAAGGVALGYLLHDVFPATINERQVAAANPFLVMLLIPYTIYGIYPLMNRFGIDPHPLQRMTIGMLLAAFSFIPIALIQHKLDAGGSVHVAWQFLPFVIVTFAEVFVSITGLEFAYSQAPKRMKSVIMGFWLINVAIGDFLVVGLVHTDMSRVTFFWVFAGLMAAAGIIFGLRARTYEYKDYTQ
ncbi:MAG: hypothetical protein CMH54_10345 [Myxococcales bacterium]|nr:hypothetical protein [Myxococcales bacterium]